ncbi:hypothetical protein EDD16DRAFT_1689588 [Pisolithus croceorrhizus]|nr:hypothetical protein EDD16DRAFT_1689588 [Pisolithus croceorrhizus]
MIPCMKTGCHRWFRNKSGLTQHMNVYHPVLLPVNCQASLPDEEESRFLLDDNSHGGNPLTDPPNVNPLAEFIGPGDKYYQNYHLHLTGMYCQLRNYIFDNKLFTGHPCDSSGHFLPTGQPPEPLAEKQPDDWSPYSSCLELELANFLFTHSQMSAGNINELLTLWNAALLSTISKTPPSIQGFADDSCAEMYKTIDRTPLGDVKWESFCTSYTGEQPTENVPPWMNDTYDIWFQDPKEDIISCDPTMHGSTFIPIILGSGKATVSVATSQNNYYPLYLSIGNIRNKVCHAHCNGVVLIAFLAILHMDKEHASTNAFQHFHHQLFHALLAYILHNLKPAMTKPVIMWFGDGHYCHVVFGLSPYIADYEEQILLACIVQGWCVKCLAMRQELDSDALYHTCEHAEVLIGEFDLKDLWDEYGIVGNLTPFTSGFPHANIYELIAPDILHQIIKGTFKDHLVEWVESYLKTVCGTTKVNAILDDIDWQIAAIAPFMGLHCFPEGHHFKQWTGNDLKVYLPAIEGHVLTGIFTYLVHHNVITEETLVAIQDTIDCFHEHQEIFCQSGIIQTFSLPCQHAMKHYPDLIHLFGAPNGLCTSITELKHIDVVKDPYQWTNRNKPLGQMLVINQCLDKLAVSRRDFNSSTNSDTSKALGSETKRARTVTDLAVELSLEHLPTIVEEFLLQQQNPDDFHGLDEVPPSECPTYGNKIAVVNSAAVLFYAPSDISGIGGMQCEYGPPWYDCMFVNTNPGLKGMHSLDIVFGDEPDADTGMWIVCPAFTTCHHPSIAVIHVDTIYHAAHLIPLYATQLVPQSIEPHHSYNIFTTFYVNKFIDHHTFSLLSDSY